jgi:hypothetical protein
MKIIFLKLMHHIMKESADMVLLAPVRKDKYRIMNVVFAAHQLLLLYLILSPGKGTTEEHTI